VNAISATARNLTDRQIDAIGESGGIIGINFHSCDIRSDGKKTTETPLAEFVKHFDYVAERIGVEHLAFGSDFDGATMPDDLSDASKLPNLLSTLSSAGFNDAALQAISHKNWLRVLESTWI
jgi:membrane dipeptidase